MKKIITLILMALGIGVQTGNAQDLKFKSISPDQFEVLLTKGEVFLLDVRTAEEYTEGHLKGAHNLDVKKADFEQKAVATLPKDKTLAIYCRSGARSTTAAGLLVKNGFTVIEMATGVNGWKAAGKPTEK